MKIKKLLINAAEFFTIVFFVGAIFFMACTTINFLIPASNLHLFINASMFTSFFSMLIAIIFACIYNLINRRDEK